jgi:undecaprenyl-diphosphatase
MENLNNALFVLLNAPAHPHPGAIAVARLLAVYVIWAVAAGLAFGWLASGERTRKHLLEAGAAATAGLVINQLIGWVWPHPRPFAIGLGHLFIAHAADPSFPSDHLTVLWAIGFSLLMHRSSRMAGLALSLLALPVAWARIYLGVHFPLDIVGAALVAALSAWLMSRCAPWFIPRSYGIVMRIHRLLAGRLMTHGRERR